MSLQLSKMFSLPKEAVLWAFVILAIRGAGKTYDAGKMAEQMIRLGIPIVVFDPMGIWWGLRVGVESHEGLPVVIFGGDHADLPIPLTISKRADIVDEDKLRLTVNAVLKAGLSVVLDTSILSRTQQTRAVGIFGDELFRKNAPYGIRHVFIEEADVYCPQKPLGDTQASHTAIDNLVRRGGNFNLGVTMITQRAAVLDKDVLSQANCLIAMRLMWDPDKKTVQTWVQSRVKNDREIKKLAKWYDSLKELKNGEAWIYSPEHDIFDKVQFGERETLHASREYFLKENWEQKNITLRDVGEFVQKFKTRLEPKPVLSKIPPVREALIGSQPGVPIQPRVQVSQEIAGPSLGDPVVPAGKPLDDWTVKQSLPTLEIHQYKPVLQLSVELSEPTSIQGKLAVVLVNKKGSNENRWSKKLISEALADHGWPSDGVDEAIEQFLRWEILIRDKASTLWFQRDRVRIVAETSPIMVS
jgi:hypothetical protein